MKIPISRNSPKSVIVVKLGGDWVLRGESFPEKTKFLRKSLGMTQVDFGDELGVQGKTISNWERGGPEPEYNSGENSRGAYQVRVRDLLIRAGLDHKRADAQSRLWADTGSEQKQKTTETPTRKASFELPRHLESLRSAVDRLNLAREAFKRSSDPQEAWRLMEQGIRGLQDDFSTIGPYAVGDSPRIETEIRAFLDLAERLCNLFLMSTADQQLCRRFARRVRRFAALHNQLSGRNATYLVGNPELRFRLANFDPMIEMDRPSVSHLHCLEALS